MYTAVAASESKTLPLVEWPTLLVAFFTYGVFGALTWWYHSLAWWVVLPLAAYIVALHGSLQHEIIHGHPTSWRALNELLIAPNLWLWMPFGVYRRSHLRHHNKRSLTDPILDPESYYTSPDRWQSLPLWRRQFLKIQNTLAGRMLIGPIYTVVRFWLAEATRLAAGDTRHVNAWLVNLLGSTLVLWWVVVVCDIPLLEYLLLFVYPGISLTLLRSFLEHEAAADPEHRSAVVESNAVMSLLYLNNNLHSLHHDAPGLPWYRLPAKWKAHKKDTLERNNGYYYPGYGEIFKRYLLTAKEHPCYPLEPIARGALP